LPTDEHTCVTCSLKSQVERILLESGWPMDIGEIAREINHRLVPLGHRQLVETNLSNQVSVDGRFAPIGRSGKWGLKSWQHVDTKSILALMEECLITHNKPTTIDEIYEYVVERRPVSKNSIIRYLSTEKEHFARASLTTWGLTEWASSTEIVAWNKEQVAEFVASIFRSNKAKELDYKMLKEALMEKASISAKQAQGLLNHNPAIKTRGTTSWGGERIAVFQPNYKALLAHEKIHSRRQMVSLRQQVIESVHNILGVLPGKQMSMTELIEQLHKQLGCPKSTLYAYFTTMDSIEKIEDPDSHIKLCRLRDSHNSTKSGTLRQQVSESVRAILEAAPNKQMSLAELITHLQKEYDCPKATLYQYIANLDYIERLDIPNSNAKICHIKDAYRLNLFPQVQHIADLNLKEKVERALPFLTEENVDIGLFLLSKEFEATLKTYFINASSKGKLSKLPAGKTPNNWNLISMVDCARDNDIISDHATFHYLRQTRNDRAHGTMPSLAERQLLMKSIQYIAGLYIDYIKFLDDLIQNL
jgi:hypothetical protein